jgi:hypothetical protein
LGGAGTALGGAALTPAVASLAPAAAAQAAGTIAPSMLQSAGLNTLKSQVIGTGVKQAAAQQASNLALQQAAAKNMAGGLANPMANAAGSQFTQVAPNLAGRDQVLQAFSRQGAGQNLTQLGPKLAGDASASSLTPQVASPYDLSTGVNKIGLNTNYQSALRPAANLVDDAGMAVADPRAEILGRGIRPDQNFMQNLGNIGSFQDVKDYAEAHPYATAGIAGLGAMGVSKMMQPKKVPLPENNAMIRPYEFDYGATGATYQPGGSTSEQLYFNPTYTAGEPYKADEKAEGGIASAYAMGGQVEQMSAMNSVGANTGYPMANINTPMYANPMMQRPEATNVIAPSADAGVGAYSGEQRFAAGGISTLGGYSDGGRLLKGPGDGVSDSIPASIGNRQPARLADGEFVVPARIVSELGNGSTEAGARKLYAMMDRVQKSRKKSVGKGKVAVDSKASKHLPA